MMNGEDKRWHLDKRVPIAMIVSFVVTIIVQSLIIAIVGAWYASEFNQRVLMVERWQTSWQSERSSIPDRLVRMEVQMLGLKEDTAEIKAILERAYRPAPTP